MTNYEIRIRLRAIFLRAEAYDDVSLVWLLQNEVFYLR